MSNTKKSTTTARSPPVGVSNVHIKPSTTKAAAPGRTSTTTTTANAAKTNATRTKLPVTSTIDKKPIKTRPPIAATTPATKAGKPTTTPISTAKVASSRPTPTRTSTISKEPPPHTQNLRTTAAAAARTTTTTTTTKKTPAGPLATASVAGKKAPTKNVQSIPPAGVSRPDKSNAVLDTYHSVTVTTPPSQRKLAAELAESSTVAAAVSLPAAKQEKRLERKGSRTLEPEEIRILKRDANRMQQEPQTSAVPARNALPIESIIAEPRKSPVAFEVNFEETNSAAITKKQQLSVPEAKNRLSESDQAEYSDDCESSFSSRGNSSAASSDHSTTTKSDEEDDDDEEEAEEEEQSSNFVSDEEEHQESPDRSKADDLQLKQSQAEESAADEEDESQSTQYPLTVINRSERKLDSGNYDLNSLRKGGLRTADLLSHQQQQHHQQDDSLDTISAPRSDNFDSGLGSGGSTNNSAQRSERTKPAASSAFACSYGGYADFNRRPVLRKRGLDLMGKLRFDTVAFTLLNMKPSSYEVYMQVYGSLNTRQAHTQTTRDNCVTREMQTEEVLEREMWTQQPPLYDNQAMQRLSCGAGQRLAPAEGCRGGASSRPRSPNNLLAVMAQLAGQMSTTGKRKLQRKRKMIDYERLNGFLLKASLLMSRVLSANTSHHHQQQHASHDNPSKLRLTSAAAVGKSSKPHQLNTQLLSALRVVRLFANNRHHLILTVHECPADEAVYRCDFTQLLMLWSQSDRSQLPLRLLSTWSEVTGAVICGDATNVIVCSLRDGSVALWNLQETSSYCSRLDGCLTHFAASHSILPHWVGGVEGSSKSNPLDLGAAVDIRIFRGSEARPIGGLGHAIQFISLHDSGLLTMWSLVKGSAPSQYTLKPPPAPARTHNKKKTPAGSTTHQQQQPSRPNRSLFEPSSASSGGMRLIQSAICDLRAFMEHNNSTQTPKSDFEKTRLLFQKNIYADELLRELNELQAVEAINPSSAGSANLQGLRFTSLDVGVERVYVCTNRNFVLCCTRTLKWERMRKIVINESRYLALTALRVLVHEDYIAVGLTNGSVIVVNCGQSLHPAGLGDDKPTEGRGTLQTPSGDKRAEEMNLEALLHREDIDTEMGKSCAIQNIILNEKLATAGHEERDFMQNPARQQLIGSANSARRPLTATGGSAAATAALHWQRVFARHLCDQQLLLSGSDLRENLVQSLELSTDGWRLFVHANGRIRAFDFARNCEIEIDLNGAVGKSKKIMDFAVTKADMADSQNMLLLNGANEVELHLLQ